MMLSIRLIHGKDLSADLWDSPAAVSSIGNTAYSAECIPSIALVLLISAVPG